jgi:hypothetical protein
MTDWIGHVRVASTGNVNLVAPGTSVDGVTLTPDNRVLVKNQTAQAQNGIYTFNGASLPMTRSSDTISPEMVVRVSEGTVNPHTEWFLQTKAPITLGTTSLVYVRLLPWADVKAFGAVGNGSTDDSAAITAAMNTRAGMILFPDGNYRVSNSVTFPAATQVHFAAGAVLLPDSGKTVTIHGHILVAETQQLFGSAGTIALSPGQSISVKWFGAKGDGATDDSPAISNAAASAAAAGSGVFFPPGIYKIAANITIPVPVSFEPGAMLSPSSAIVTLAGTVIASNTQQIFASNSTGVNSAVTQVGRGPGITLALLPLGPYGTYSFKVVIVSGGPIGNATFQVTVNGVTASTTPIQAFFTVPGTGVVIGFSGTYIQGTTYTWTASAPFAFGIVGTVATLVSPRWWGAKGDGVTIDTAALQGMIGATTKPGGVGSHYHIPAGSYAIDDTILFDGLIGGLITGDSSGFLWVGGFDATYQNPIPAIHIRNSQYMVWQDIGISVGSGKRLAEGWRLTTHAGGAFVNIGHTFSACSAGGTTDQLELGVRIGGDLDNNNDGHRFINCQFANFGNAAIEIQDSQCYNISLFGCIILGFFDPHPNNNTMVAPKSAVLSWNPASFVGFGQKDVNKWIEVTQDDGTVVRTTIASWNPASPNQVTLADSCPAGATPGHAGSGVVFGSQCAVACRALQPAPTQNGQGGGFTWVGGEAGNCMYTAYFIGTGNAGPITIRDCTSESSRHFLVQPGATEMTRLLVVIDSCRISGDGVSAQDPQVIQFGSAGKLEIRHTNIGDVDQNAPLAIYYSGGPFPPYQSFILDHCDISTNLDLFPTKANPSSKVFPHLWPTDVRDSFIRQFVQNMPPDKTAIPIGNRAPYLEGPPQGTNAFPIPWGAYKTQYVQIDRDTQFIFENPLEGFGSNMRMILRANFAQPPFNVTWPAEVIWDSEGPPNIPNNGVPTIIEFSYTNDSTDLMGPVILGRVVTQRSDQFQASLTSDVKGNVGNVARKNNSRFLKIVEPATAAFTISGFDAAPDGFVLDVYNATGQQMTIKNQDSNGGTVPAANQIQTLRGTGPAGDVVLRAGPSFVSFVYDAGVPFQPVNQWVLRSTN